MFLIIKFSTSKCKSAIFVDMWIHVEFVSLFKQYGTDWRRTQ